MKTNVSLYFLLATLIAAANARAVAPDYRSDYLAIGLSASQPAFSWFGVDSLGQGKLTQNPILEQTREETLPGLALKDNATYTLNGKLIWQVACGERGLTLASDYAEGAQTPPFILAFNQKSNHATLLGRMKPGERRMGLPCVLHLPDMGSFRITANTGGLMLDYDARRFNVSTPFVRIAFPGATAQQPHIEYRFEVAAIHPELPGIEDNPRYDGFRRDFLNIFQVNPRVLTTAATDSSITRTAGPLGAGPTTR